MATVELKQAVKRFGDIEVIHGVDLALGHGEFVVFVGPSGCGKSTLLRMIAGLEELSDGSVHIGDRDVTHVSAVDRGIAMVFQSYALYPHMSVEQNMGFGLRMNGVPRKEVRDKVSEAARTLQLDHLLDRKPKNLSGGQRQRVAIGRAIVREPKVFLFDEPLSNLDAELRVEMRLQIARLHNQIDATMIYVTHDQVEAMTLADRIVVLRDGHVEQVGSPMMLYQQPANRFVAGFIGSPKMNFLNGKLVSASDTLARVAVPERAGGSAELDVACDARALAAGDPVTLGIRPEHLQLGNEYNLEMDVDVVERLGGTTFLYGRCADHENFAIARDGNETARSGDRTGVGFAPESGYLFDHNGKALNRFVAA